MPGASEEDVDQRALEVVVVDHGLGPDACLVLSPGLLDGARKSVEQVVVRDASHDLVRVGFGELFDEVQGDLSGWARLGAIAYGCSSPSAGARAPSYSDRYVSTTCLSGSSRYLAYSRRNPRTYTGAGNWSYSMSSI